MNLILLLNCVDTMKYHHSLAATSLPESLCSKRLCGCQAYWCGLEEMLIEELVKDWSMKSIKR